MEKNSLFSYKINDTDIEVCHETAKQEAALTEAAFLEGFQQAIAEHLCLPFHIIAPRIKSLHNIVLIYDKERLKAEEFEVVLATKNAVIDFFHSEPENEKLIIPYYADKPDTSDDYLISWAEDIFRETSETEVLSEFINSDSEEKMQWVKFTYSTDNKEYSFYGKYYHTDMENASLLVSLPGYQSDWNDLSEYYGEPYDILQLSPMGYNTPYGYDEEKKLYGTWPVLFDTVVETDMGSGYRKWFMDCILAIGKIKRPDQKLLFMGTSQGGGASLVLTSLFKEEVVACAAEMPFFIGFSDDEYNTIISFVTTRIRSPKTMVYDFYTRERLYVIDPLNHADRVVAPTLLVAGEKDYDCPKEGIYKLYQKLNCPKKYVLLKNQGHGYTKEFIKESKAWLRDHCMREDN